MGKGDYKKPKYNEIYNRFLSSGFILLDKNIKSSKQKLTCVDFDGYKYKFAYNNLHGIKKNARKFSKFNPYVLYNIQKYLDKYCDGAELISNKYNGSKSKIEIKCPICGKNVFRTWDDIHIKKRFYCHSCSINNNKYNIEFVKDVLSKNNYTLIDNTYVGNCDNLTCFNKDGYKVHIKFSYILNSYNKNPYIYSIKYNEENFIYNINNYFKINKIDCKALYYKNDSEYLKNEKTRIFCKCCCGDIFETSLYALLNDRYRCPKCSKSMSSIELKVYKWLNNKHFYYIRQKTFAGCNGHDKPLKFDFYLPKYNTCIEVDGTQHDIPDFYYGKYKNKDKAQYMFQRQKEYDDIKDKYCEENNITLIRIKNKDIYKSENYKKILYNNLIKPIK